MNIAKQIRIQRLQNKNRMVGQTFNPQGHTAESLDSRERQLIAKYRDMTYEERNQIRSNYIVWEEYKHLNGIYCSNSFEMNVFLRHYSIDLEQERR